MRNFLRISKKYFSRFFYKPSVQFYSNDKSHTYNSIQQNKRIDNPKSYYSYDQLHTKNFIQFYS